MIEYYSHVGRRNVYRTAVSTAFVSVVTSLNDGRGSKPLDGDNSALDSQSSFQPGHVDEPTFAVELSADTTIDQLITMLSNGMQFDRCDVIAEPYRRLSTMVPPSGRFTRG